MLFYGRDQMRPYPSVQSLILQASTADFGENLLSSIWRSAMYDPDEIAERIAEYREQIENLKRLIAELMWLSVCDSEGNITSYADLEHKF